MCVIDGCIGVVFAKGMCQKHYNRVRRHGNPHAMLRHSDPMDNLRSSINRSPIIPQEYPGFSHGEESKHV